MTSKAKAEAQERAEAIRYLKERGIKPGATLYTVVRHVARSGMQRHISVLFVQKGRIANVSYLVALATGHKMAKDRDALKVDGCGMDMGFAVIYNLGRTLFPKGGSLKHTNGTRQRQEAKRGRETDGGYLLRQEWV